MLYINEGANGTPLHEVTAYTGTSSSTYTFNVGDVVGSHTIATSMFYTIAYAAENAVGKSQDSEHLYVATARSPETPSAPTFDLGFSTRTMNII